ncbi:MAG: mechanosensitive ion channel family protein [Steroidobacteraceae bacterium]
MNILRTALLAALLAAAATQAAGPAVPPSTSDSRAVMSAEQVIGMLDDTVDWYRTLGTQQQAATQPSELLVLYANRQAADKVMAIAFEIARANAELLSSEEGLARERAAADAPQSLTRLQGELNGQRASLQAQIDAAKAEQAGARPPARAQLQARIQALQGQLDLINARRNLLANQSQFEWETDVAGFGANALKAHIDAIAASIPNASGAGAPATAAAAAAKPADAAQAGAVTTALQAEDQGIWGLAATAMRLRTKLATIRAIEERTQELQEMFDGIREPPQERLRQLAAQGDALSAQSGDATTTGLRSMRDQYDTLAWLFQQTSAMVAPLSKVDVLLTQYRRNLDTWHELGQRQLSGTLRALLVRTGIFLALLALVLGAAHLWKRAVYRYVLDGRRRARHMLLRRILTWALVAAIAIWMFATEIGSLATFAGLITAGLAVALQSVLVSVVGYFFLVGKYGVRVGDRVQIGNVTGEVVDLGLVRLHLMEMKGDGANLSPTGRIVAFANSVVFQASGGLFKQIPGIDLTWHEITLTLPPDVDHAAMKQQLADATSTVLQEYQEDILRQAQKMQRDASVLRPGDMQPQVQLHFSASGVEALVRYPVVLQAAAAIDERVSRELLAVTTGTAR